MATRMPGIRPYPPFMAPPPPPPPARFGVAPALAPFSPQPFPTFRPRMFGPPERPRFNKPDGFKGWRGQGVYKGQPGAQFSDQRANEEEVESEETSPQEENASESVVSNSENNSSVAGPQSNGVDHKTESKKDGDALNLKDKQLPRELTEKFSPLHCDLCVVKMNSTVQAKMHYNGKQHQKKVRMFLVTWSQEHGEPVPKKLHTETSSKPAKQASDPEDLYCKCCDLSFTSALHAQQHYMGRNHQRVMKGLSPLRTGYYNRFTGKWQRFPPNEQQPGKFDPSGRFGIGKAFMKDQPAEEEAEEVIVPLKGRFYCELCKVGATSQEQLDMHFNGSKHKKAMKSKKETPTGKPN